VPEFHHIKITAEKAGYKSRIEIDDWDVHGVTMIEVEIDAQDTTRVTIELVPRLLEIEGDGVIEMGREILPIKRREAGK
jgi:hypothetical protein